MVKSKVTLTHADVELLIEMMKHHFVTQDQFTAFRSDIMDKLDLIVKNTSSTQEELLVTQSVVTNHTFRLDRVDNVLNLPSLI